MKAKHLFALFLTLVFSGCDSNKPPPIPAFYHWQTHLSISETEDTILDTLNAQYLFVKCFDVDWSFTQQEAIPKAVLTYEELPDVPIIPTVFITNRTFQEIEKEQISGLAEQVFRKIESLFPNYDFKEVQFDCDWSGSTRDQYFAFLEKMREKLPEETKLSATIRLHQFANPQQTGVPPVDRGMLMFYNMGEIKNWQEPNSILNLSTAKHYLENDNYVLPLDFALPLFRWGLVFRDEKMMKIINELDETNLIDRSFFLQTDRSRYEVIKSTYLDGYYLYKGDQVRLEAADVETLKNAAELLHQIDRAENCRLTFYYLDDIVLQAYTSAELAEVLDVFVH